MIGKVTSFDEKPTFYGQERKFTLQVDIKGDSAVELLSKLFDQDRVVRGVVDISTPITFTRDILPKNILESIRNSFRYRYGKAQDKVIFNEPATILYKDGKKYVCKCDKHDSFNEELGLALCLLKSFGVTYSDFRKLLDNAKRQGVKND